MAVELLDMATLTPEQLQRIEENKRRAQELRRSKLLNQQSASATVYQNNKNSFSDTHHKRASDVVTVGQDTLKRSSSSTVPCPEAQSPKRVASETGDNRLQGVKTVLPFYGNIQASSHKNSTSSTDLWINNAAHSNVRADNDQNIFGKSQSSNKITGYCKLVSKDRFVIDVGYHKRMIDIFKTMGSAKYDAPSKRWSFHIKDHNLLLKVLDAEPDLSISKLPDIVLRTFLSAPPAPVNYEIDLSRIDKQLVENLMPFQREGICFGISRKGRCLIADDMGLGKTVQGLGIAHYYYSDWPLLIVTPSSVRYLWLEAVLSWLPSVPLHHVEVMNTGKDYVGDARVVILSYDLLARHHKDLNLSRFGIVILDESHFLKNIKTARTKAALFVARGCRRVVLLSGTPALSRPCELYTQIAAIEHNAFPSFQTYGIRYCAGKQTKWGWDFSGSSNMEELQLLLEHRFMIRRLKSDVITQLPSKMRQVVVLNPSSINMKSDEVESWLKRLHSKQLSGMQRRGALLSFFAATGNVKLKAVKDYIADLLEAGKKFICFVHHKVVMDGLSKTMEDKKASYIKIDGSTTASERKALCDKFQFDDNYSAALLSITAANAGITLTAAKLVVFAELFWNPGILIQAEDRAHRIGQRDSVLVQYLIAKGTADDHLWPMIQNKLDVLHKAGLSKDSFMQSDTAVVKDKTQSTLEDFFDELNDSSDNLLADVVEEIEFKEDICCGATV
ncbi:SWI/SNF-related matrix-associated actin-dependent regulator of chromatin subfamily A-like protein 1 isoform X1 [Schistocerca serialis cubense]|uniref:SWI/SNF-related matrix-associated actin-dependent regulator of chromatin subfamily A-like protein 1 isoform X1 n=2 Tax=Schistocerca serialis cubense TaxID=2023355 RepID=UPI00214EB84C|nr:SWI/SNF-related matrix-associated actin-dependent regulator of chromatin subfamily A-like protein 1 isoform X1 [Schistocerca serialis cubense]